MYIVEYPYLQELYNFNANEGRYYKDTIQDVHNKQRFLETMDLFLNQRRYVRVTLLDWDENPIKEIQGELTSGNLIKDGTSAVRRSCTFSAVVGGGKYDVQDLEMSFSLNKKIYLETGVKNDSNKYPEYPILWFPQGLFFITSISLSSSTSSGVNISIQCRDKMCLLNGEIGGLFPATTVLDVLDYQDPTGRYVQKKVPIYDLIIELVNHFGGEQLNNIVVEDVDTEINRIIQWKGENSLYVSKNNEGAIELSLDEPSGVHETYETGADIGFMRESFYYANELTANAGQTVCSVLDSIKNYLGNYEYFYDIYGIFHFQEIKNYLNTTQGKILVDDMSKNDYLVDTTLSKDLYSFDSNRNLVSINVSPQYQNIKNDFTILGSRKLAGTNTAYPVRYHLVIDRKPVGNIYKVRDSKYVKWILPDDMDDDQLSSMIDTLRALYQDEIDPDLVKNITLKRRKKLANDLLDVLGKYSSAIDKLDDGDTDKDHYQQLFDNLTDIINQEDEEESDDEEEEEEWEDRFNKYEMYSYYPETNHYFYPDPSNKLGYAPFKDLLIYEEQDSKLHKGAFLDLLEGSDWNKAEIPDSLNFNLIYALKNDNGEVDYEKGFKYWYDGQFKDVVPLAFFEKYYPIDWRTELYVIGLYNRSNATDEGYYFQELCDGWPAIYDLESQKFWFEEDGSEEMSSLKSNTPVGDYYLDFIDPSMTSLGKFAVEAIGRRQFVHKQDDINCLFEPIIPDIEYISEDDDEIERKRENAAGRMVDFAQVPAKLYENMYTGGYHNDAFSAISYDLAQHTTYQSNISLTAIPADYMEPNTRVYISDKTTNTYGSFVITNITMPLAPGGNMSVTAHEAIERY